MFKRLFNLGGGPSYKGRLEVKMGMFDAQQKRERLEAQSKDKTPEEFAEWIEDKLKGFQSRDGSAIIGFKDDMQFRFEHASQDSYFPLDKTLFEVAQLAKSDPERFEGINSLLHPDTSKRGGLER